MLQLPPAVGGSITALSWGSADFIARFTSRALGVPCATFWMFTTSALLLIATTWIVGASVQPVVTALSAGDPAALLMLLYGAGVTVATLLFYQALTLGPVTVAAPIGGSYPAFNVLVALALGTRPSAGQWLAMLMVMLGVAVVGRFARQHAHEHGDTPARLRVTVMLALSAAAMFGISIAAGQEAGARYGDLQVVCFGRWIGVAMCAALLLPRSRSIAMPLRWWPMVTLQGALDASAYVTVLLASTGAKSPVAAVIASAFSVVTVVLARVVLREQIGLAQWLGIALVVTGVAGLSAS